MLELLPRRAQAPALVNCAFISVRLALIGGTSIPGSAEGVGSSRWNRMGRQLHQIANAC